MQRVLVLGKAITASGAAQGVASASNLILNLVLIRFVTPSDFGIYGIGFAVVLLYASMGSALFLSQMVANAPDRAPEVRDTYISTMFVAFVGFVVASVLIVSGAAGLLFLTFDNWRPYVEIWVAFTIFAAAYQAHQFFVTYSFLVRREILALLINSIVALLLFGIVALTSLSEGGITVTGAVLAYSVGLFTASCFGFRWSEISVREATISRLRSYLGESWENGKWALGGVAVNWLQTQAYVTVTAVMLGPAGVGLANAARVFITPFAFVLPAINQVVMPRLSSRRVSDRQSVLRLGKFLVLGLVTLACVYTLCLWLSIDFLAEQVLDKQYEAALPLVWIWCAALFLQLIRGGAVSVLQALKHFRGITLDNTISAVLACLITVIAVRTLGVTGAVLSIAVGEALLAALLWRRAIRVG